MATMVPRSARPPDAEEGGGDETEPEAQHDGERRLGVAPQPHEHGGEDDQPDGRRQHERLDLVRARVRLAQPRPEGEGRCGERRPREEPAGRGGESCPDRAGGRHAAHRAAADLPSPAPPIRASRRRREAERDQRRASPTACRRAPATRGPSPPSRARRGRRPGAPASGVPRGHARLRRERCSRRRPLRERPRRPVRLLPGVEVLGPPHRVISERGEHAGREQRADPDDDDRRRHRRERPASRRREPGRSPGPRSQTGGRGGHERRGAERWPRRRSASRAVPRSRRRPGGRRRGRSRARARRSTDDTDASAAGIRMKVRRETRKRA